MLVATLCAPGHMPAERFGPAGFNRRHHLELGQADMPRIGLPPRGTMSAEDVSDLQPGPGHPGARSLQTSRQCLTLQFGQRFIGADRVSDRFGGDMGVLCSGRQFGVAEQHLDDPHVRVGFQQMRGKTVS